jgi:hypothetical protein
LDFGHSERILIVVLLVILEPGKILEPDFEALEVSAKGNGFDFEAMGLSVGKQVDFFNVEISGSGLTFLIGSFGSFGTGSLIRFFGRTPPDSDQVKISSAQRTTIK